MNCHDCKQEVSHDVHGFAVPHLAGFFKYCPGGGFPEKAESQADYDMMTIRRAREAARAQWGEL